MKKIFLTLVALSLVYLFFSGNVKAHAVTIRHNGSDTLPKSDSIMVGHMIQKLTDTLGLSADQQQKVSAACYMLDYHRLAILRKYKGKSDSLGYYIIHLERSRDSCFMSVLTMAQYRIYGRKKPQLVHNN